MSITLLPARSSSILLFVCGLPARRGDHMHRYDVTDACSDVDGETALSTVPSYSELEGNLLNIAGKLDFRGASIGMPSGASGVGADRIGRIGVGRLLFRCCIANSRIFSLGIGG